MHYALFGLLAALWAVFAVSATGKVRHPAAFAASLRGILPGRLVTLAARALTAAELAVTLGLSLALLTTAGLLPGGRAVPFAALTATALLITALTVGVAITLHRGTGGSCSCFGTTRRPLGRRHLARNLLLLAAAAAALLLLATGPPDASDPLGLLLGIAAGGIAASLVIGFDAVAELFTPTPLEIPFDDLGGARERAGLDGA
jgi:hypothetical protein